MFMFLIYVNVTLFYLLSSLRGRIFSQKRVCILCSAASWTSPFKHICTRTIFGTASQCPKIIFHALCVAEFSSIQVRHLKWKLGRRILGIFGHFGPFLTIIGHYWPLFGLETWFEFSNFWNGLTVPKNYLQRTLRHRVQFNPGKTFKMKTRQAHFGNLWPLFGLETWFEFLNLWNGLTVLHSKALILICWMLIGFWLIYIYYTVWLMEQPSKLGLLLFETC